MRLWQVVCEAKWAITGAESRRLIVSGFVSVNGGIVRDSEHRLNFGDTLCFHGEEYKI